MHPSPSPEETLEAFLERSGRHSQATPIRKSFVQRGPQSAPAPGPLAELVRRHDDLGLRLYLLLLTAATAAPWDCVRDAIVWARALDLKVKGGGYDTVAISRAWQRLERLGLIQRGRRGRTSRPQLLREDGSGRPYDRPGGGRRSPYLRLPFVFWQQGWHRRLHLPGLAMLLISLDLPDDFALPTEKAQPWYGLSAETARRGFDELIQHGLLTVRQITKPAPLTAVGWTRENRYTLRAPFTSSRKPHELASVRPLRSAS